MWTMFQIGTIFIRIQKNNIRNSTNEIQKNQHL
jgi:hypothetical protein